MSCKVYCNQREGCSGDRPRGHNSVREGSRLLVYLAKVISSNLISEITCHRHPIGVFGGVFEAFVYPLIGHFFMSDSNNFTGDVGFFICCLIGKIWTLSTVILPSLHKRSVKKDPTGMVGALAEDVIEWIRGCGCSKTGIPLAFKVVEELKGTTIKVSGGLVRETLIVIDKGISDR